MSEAFKQKFGTKKVSKAAMREWCQRPGKRNKDGTIQYFTEQHHKRECDVNEIIKKYDKQGIITHVSKFEARFGDMSGADFKSMQDKITGAISMFNELPSGIRNRFDNSPAELLHFMDNPNNRQEAIDLGLIRESWTPETDGLGEHIKEGENVNVSDKKREQQEQPELPLKPNK
jgi:hypothetical protein